MNLPTGTSVEKVLINCFKSDDNIYAVFDAENVGSMGLPIILISKLVNNRLTKIVEPDEWTKVKGCLKEIISGVSKEYVSLQETLDADELFYNQLTLPVASFDALKNAYKIDNVVNNELPLSGVNNVEESTLVESLEQGVEETNKPLEIQSTNGNLLNADIDKNLPELSTVVDENSEKKEDVINEISLPVLEETSLDNSSNVSSTIQDNVSEKEDVVANPLVNDVVLPTLDLPVVDSGDNKSENLNETPVLEEAIDQSVNLSADNVTPIVDASLEKVGSNFEFEKEEFLNYCSEFFDKMVEKIKNN